MLVVLQAQLPQAAHAEGGVAQGGGAEHVHPVGGGEQGGGGGGRSSELMTRIRRSPYHCDPAVPGHVMKTRF